MIGAVAISGYCLSAFLTNKIIDLYDYCIAIVLAAIGMYLIYYFEYYFYTKNISSANSINVWKYIAYSVETSKLYIRFTKISSFQSIGPSAILGYLSLIINFIGFILGSLSVIVIFGISDKCTRCHQYLRSKKKKIFYFDNLDELKSYEDNISKFNITPGSFKSILFTTTGSTFNKLPNSIKYIWKLKKCNGCKAETLFAQAWIYQDKEWSIIKDSKQKIVMPAHSNIEKVWH